MNYKYSFTKLASRDLEQTIKYIKEELNAPKAATELYGKVSREIEIIVDAPFSYPSCEIYLEKDVNIRHAIIGNHIMIYVVNQLESTITFLRFLYGKRNIREMMKNIEK